MSTPADQNPFAPPTARVDDVVAAGAPLSLGGRGRRLAAVMLDGAIGGVVTLAVMLVAVPGMSLSDPDPSLLFGRVMLPLGVLTLLFAGVQIYLLVTRGQTIGKMLLGLRIVRSDGSRVGGWRLIGLRMIVTGLLASIPFIGTIFILVDSLMIFRDSRQCLHDNIADTIVVTA